jgi:Tfp pilus assembly protein PilV
LEALITIVIVSIGMLGVASLQIMAIKAGSFGQQTTVASTLAQNKMEYLRQVTFDTVANGNDTYVDQVNGVTYTRQWIVQNDSPQPGMKTVEVRITWTGPQANRSIAVSGLISEL